MADEDKLDSLFKDLLSRDRATEADYDAATDAIAEGSKTEADVLKEWTPMALEIGAEVTIADLKARKELNGKTAQVVSYDPVTKRFAVRITGASVKIAVRRANLVDSEPDSAAAVLENLLGTDAAAHVGSFLTCTRCGEPCAPGSKCRVPHPRHMRQDLGMSCGPDGMRSSYACGACGEQYEEVRNIVGEFGQPGVGFAEEVQIIGPKWCFAGVHTTQPLDDSDQRRVFPNTIALNASPELQAQIDALPANVRTLTIGSSGFYDEDMAITLDREFPELEELQLVDVAFERIALTADLAPKLRKLRMQNVSDECDLTLELPTLRSVTIHFLRGESDEAINTMLRHATRLESFDSYKLWMSELHFASNALESIDLHRSDALETLTIWAPNLRCLGLQACYGLEDLQFLTTHPTLASEIPADHRPPPLEVNTVNASLGPRARRALKQHPAVVASRTRHQGMPTEEMFAGMHAGGAFDDEYGGSDDDNDDDDDDDEFNALFHQAMMRGTDAAFAAQLAEMGLDDYDYDDESEGEEEEEEEESEEEEDSGPPPLEEDAQQQSGDEEPRIVEIEGND